MGPPSAALALKEANGGKLPEISRKIKACIECRKLKIKCYMTDSKPPCTRCKGRSLSCTVSKSIQMLMESDISWKEEMQQRVLQLEQQLSGSGSHLSENRDPVTCLPPAVHHSRGSYKGPSLCSHPANDQTVDISLNFSCRPGGFPAAAFTGMSTDDIDHSTNVKGDLVTRGTISEATAAGLYQFYHDHLDHYAYELLAKEDTLSDVRSRSSLLTSAVCTVAAFCKAPHCYEDCVRDFKLEVSKELFSNEHTFDDVRALCVGSLWLYDMAVTMSALAVRFASELNLHRCITKMPHNLNDVTCYQRTRLYFIVVICDHQCALRYGRPPMTRTLRSLQNPRALLRCCFSVPMDIILISHLELWTLNSRVLDGLGADTSCAIPPERFKTLKQLGAHLDTWQKQWSQLIGDRDDVNALSDPLLQLYFQASKLGLYSHALRGLGPHTSVADISSTINTEAIQAGTHAIDSALAFLRGCITNRSELHRLPLYLDTMIAFAVVLLLSMLTPFRSIYLETTQKCDIYDTLLRLSGLLNGVALTAYKKHPLSVIATSLNASLADPMWTVDKQQQSFMAGMAHTNFLAIPQYFQPGPEQRQSNNSDVNLPTTTALDINWTVFADDIVPEPPSLRHDAQGPSRWNDTCFRF